MSPFYSDEQVSPLVRKVPLLKVVVLLFVFVVLTRLFYLQVIKGEGYQILSEQISVREEELLGRRGLILDRNSKVLADNRPYLEIVVIPQKLKNKEKTIDSLVRLIPLSKKDIETSLRKSRGQPPFLPVVIRKDPPYDWVSKIREYDRLEENGDEEISLLGIEVQSHPLRLYRYPELFSHVLGYLKEVDKEGLEEKEKSHPGKYSMGDLVGASGVESAYDLELKGDDGVKARVVDAKGREILGKGGLPNPDIEELEERSSVAPKDGFHVMTTLDFEAQEAAAKALGERRGGVAAIDPNNGEVLVLYSSPGFDGNRIMKNIDKAYWQKISSLNEGNYLYDKAIQGTYPPGSTYKIVGAVAGLETGKINSTKHFGCGGGLQFGNRYFQCWRKGGHGSVEVVRALTQSCDVFFYNVGLKVGVDGLSHYAHLMGLGEKTGIEIPFEKSGLIPSSEWKMKRYKKPWIESETLSIAIGQGADLVTPLQNARMIAMIANGGRPLTPHLGKAILDAHHHIVQEIKKSPGVSVIKPEVLKLIQEGLIGVVYGQGTAGRLRSSPYKIAGKTGTSQVIGYESKRARTERTKDHAWFVAYAPYDNPKIAVSVLVENGGHGGSAAAPVAQAVIDAYLGKIMPLKK